MNQLPHQLKDAAFFFTRERLFGYNDDRNEV